MKIGVISDTHGDAAGWQKVMKTVFYDVDLVIHAGDILYHGPRNPLVEGYNPMELAEMINSCPAPVLIARGNCDAEVDQLLIDYPIQTPYSFLQIENFRVMAHHGDGLTREDMLRLAVRYRADLFISGHTHIPVLEQENEVVLLNPGSPSLPKGDGNPTVAMLECLKGLMVVQIINLDNAPKRSMNIIIEKQ